MESAVILRIGFCKRAEVTRKTNIFRSRNGKDGGVSSSSSSFISRSFADPRAGSVLRLGSKALPRAALSTWCNVLMLTLRLCRRQRRQFSEGEGARACLHRDPRLNSFFRGMEIDSERILVNQGRDGHSSIRAMDVSAEGEAHVYGALEWVKSMILLWLLSWWRLTMGSRKNRAIELRDRAPPSHSYEVHQNKSYIFI